MKARRGFAVFAASLRTFGGLRVQDLQEDFLVDVLYVNEVSIVGVDGLFKTLKLLWTNKETKFRLAPLPVSRRSEGRQAHVFAGGRQVSLDDGQRNGNQSVLEDPLPHCAAVIVELLQKDIQYKTVAQSFTILIFFFFCKITKQVIAHVWVQRMTSERKLNLSKNMNIMETSIHFFFIIPFKKLS